MVMGRIATASLLILALGGAGAPASGWRDLNHDGKRDIYEDARQPIDRRVEDLLRQMTLAEKAGMLLHGTLPTPGSAIGFAGTTYDAQATATLLNERHISSFITRLVVSPSDLAAQNNAVQKLAEASRLGIPATISTDPRHHFQATLGASTTGGGFSLWPDTLGFAALGDAAMVRRFGDIARQEYRAVGIHMALSPQADLATEPRWPRFSATFGSDPAQVSQLAGAYVEGFQHGRNGVQADGVATVVKHWVSYGAEPEGFDGHNYYGRNAQLSDGAFAQHIRAFDDSLAARSAGVMPTYVIVHGPKIAGKPIEPVAAGFNKQMLTGLLRGEKGYDGLIVSDWSITNDCPQACLAPDAQNPQTPASIGTPWGMETADKTTRFARGIDAGIDQFGGASDSAPILEAVAKGLVSEQRIDESVRRVLRLKFELGLFDNPYVDAAAAARIVGNPAAQAAADAAQRASQVLLRNDGALLPVAPGKRIWLHGVDAAAARAAGFIVVDDPVVADVALVRTATPFETLHPHHFFGARQHEGRLDFRAQDKDVQAIARAAAHVPVIVAVEMDRPAILTAIEPLARAMLVTFGASDAAVLDVVTGRATARGRLPFALPRSMADVEAQRPDLPDDGPAPAYPRGAGLSLPARSHP
ncbi:glycoside hydrolase family 3 protein [Sphingobium sp. CAP-1]|uniref:glycoside hydrolase family 3 protein n=1 Tax=Sphingobium sp. CAP-1 TaxID=2676077 RepID=UPI0012BB22F3|nr:glycoside hydrolase family 3 N-terminal domain-containing protein [Sphingobium sp. CAP-1]QGP81232.1 glycoside hydrolase family 3 protein [Sphingobium sp. CAP-1]